MDNTASFKIVAVDGGAATGKSSTARALAEHFNFMHVDTGAHYRTVSFALLQAGTSPDAPTVIPNLLDDLQLGTELQGRSAMLSVNGAAPTDAEIRSAEVNAAVSQFAAIPELRKFLFEYQRNQAAIAREYDFAGLIMEGRDIGSVIFPDADFRFFLHADEATRAARRAKEGQTDSIAERDKLDKSRKTAPLVCPEGATQVDTGSLPLQGVVNHIAKLIKEGK